MLTVQLCFWVSPTNTIRIQHITKGNQNITQHSYLPVLNKQTIKNPEQSENRIIELTYIKNLLIK